LAQPIQASSSEASKPFYLRKAFIIPVIVIVILLIVGYIVYLMVTPAYPWLFKGAYAVYRGSAKHPIINETVDITMKVVVIDLNKTHAAIETYVKVVSSNYTNETREVRWIPTGGELALPARIASALTGPETKKVYIEGLGRRECYVYTYSLGQNGTVIGYIDKDTMWPVMFELKYVIKGHPVEITLKLVESNIPGLSK